MITVGMNYQVLPDKGQVFEDMFKAVIQAMQEIDGHRRTGLYRDVFDASRYVILSDWADRESFDAFIASETFRRVADWGKEKILAGRPSHEYYEH